MARPRRGYRLVLGLFLAGLVAFIWIDTADRSVQHPTARLRNGATVELVGITTSAPHRFTLGNPVQRLMRSFFPATTWEWLGGHSKQANLDSPAPEVVWFRYRQDHPTRFEDDERIYITDEHGCRTDAGVLSWTSSSYSGGSTAGPRPLDDLVAVPLSRYPHRGRRLGVEFASPFYSPPGTADVAIDIPTPPSVPLPQWTPDPLPITRHLGGANWTLTTFRTGLKWRGSSRYEGYWLPETEAHVQVDPPEALNTAWQIKEMRVVDPAGDTFPDRPNLVTQNTTRGHAGLRFIGGLFPEEPAWKVHLELARGPAAHFAPNELWTIEQVPLSPADVLEPFRRTGTFAGVRWTCYGVQGYGTGYAIVLDAASVDANLVVSVVDIRDDRGRHVVPSPNQDRKTIWRRRGHTEFLLPFQRKGREGRLNVTLAVQRTQPVEFLAAPERPHNL